MGPRVARLTKYALSACHAIEVAEARHGRPSNAVNCAEYLYRQKLKLLGDAITDEVGYPVRRGEVPVPFAVRKVG